MRIVNSSFILLSFVSIALSFTPIDVEKFPQVYLDSVFKGATCGQVYSNGNNSYISIEMGDFYLHPRVKYSKQLTIPIVAIRHSHLAFYKNLHTLQDFNEMYSNPFDLRREMYREFLLKNLLEIDNIHLNETLGNPEVFFRYLYNGRRKKPITSLKLKIEQSGIYCVFMVPPEEFVFDGIMSAKVTYVSSNGYLSPEDNFHYCNLKWSSVIGTIIFVMMISYYKFKILNQPTDIGDFSSIYRGVLFYCFGPILVVNSLFLIPFSLTKNIAPSPKFQDAIHYSTETLKLVKHFLMIYVFQYLPIMFSMGYGIIYTDSKNIQNHKWKKLAKIMLFLDIFCSAIVMIQSIIHPFKDIKELSNSYAIMIQRQIDRYKDIKELSYNLYLLLRYIIPLILASAFEDCSKYLWKILYFYFHLQTIKRIRKFPIFEDLAVTERVIWSFRVSSLVFYFANIIIENLLKIAGLTALELSFLARFRSQLEIIGYRRAEEVHKFLMFEHAFLGDVIKYLKYWSEELGSYIIFLLIFIIWNFTSKIILNKKVLKKSKKD